MSKLLKPTLVAIVKIATPAAAGAFGLWLLTAAPDIHRAVCMGG